MKTATLGAVDFTRMKRGAPARGSRTVETCPKCGRNGERSVFREGGSKYVHKGVAVTDFMFRATEVCLIPAAVQPPKEEIMEETEKEMTALIKQFVRELKLEEISSSEIRTSLHEIIEECIRSPYDQGSV